MLRSKTIPAAKSAGLNFDLFYICVSFHYLGQEKGICAKYIVRKPKAELTTMVSECTIPAE